MLLCGPIARVECTWVSFWPQNKTMLGALIIVFREVIEAGLIVGIVMAATRGVAGRGRWVSFGIGAGVLGAAVVAIFAGAISQAFEGAEHGFILRPKAYPIGFHTRDRPTQN